MTRQTSPVEHRVAVTNTPDRIVARCPCGLGVDVKNTGMGPLRVAAFASKHGSRLEALTGWGEFALPRKPRARR